MYKVLIVDDELLVRVGLKTTIDWTANGFKVVAEASNGEEAYEQYKKYMPDVIITDIKMPKKDGLWLVEEIRKENRNAKILCLTCYDEFSYVRKALQLGANDYLLKFEIEDDELMAHMRSIKKSLDADNKSKNLNENLIMNRNDIKKAIFADMIKFRFNIDANLSDRCAGIEFPLFNTKFAFASVSINDSLDDMHMETTQFKQRNQAIRNIFLNLFAERSIECLYSHLTKKYTFILSSPSLNKIELKKMFETAINSVKQYFDCSLNIVYTDIFENIFDSQSIYELFDYKAQILFYKDGASYYLSSISNIHLSEPKILQLVKEYDKQLIEVIGQESSEGAKLLINRANSYFVQYKVNPKLVKIFWSKLISNIFSSYGLFIENNKEIHNLEYYHQQLEIYENIKGMTYLLTEFTSTIINSIKQMKYINSKLLINRALNYINNHYHEKISLEDVAQNLHLSKHYLCNVFKKATGENMSLYINNLRIEKAKRLLLESDGRAKEIFEEVGYSNQQYFSRVFKKITGMTIMEYKEQKLLNK
ncbi:response regulator [Bacillus sp. FJAT-27445]|uniref:response regulator transcription factor n=1 Tax=Bacillus sp. FJAT-27445 TaxID=1679166 RepID=UPI000B2B0FF3|nr:response regulator [Bacillus sp. FJAT-27445]